MNMNRVTPEHMELWTKACADAEEAAAVLKEMQNKEGLSPAQAHLFARMRAALDAQLDMAKKAINNSGSGLTAEQVEAIERMRASIPKFLDLLKGLFEKD